MNGYLTNYGYMGYVSSIKSYQLFSTEKEYEETINEFANNAISIMKGDDINERKNILDT